MEERCAKCGKLCYTFDGETDICAECTVEEWHSTNEEEVVSRSQNLDINF